MQQPHENEVAFDVIHQTKRGMRSAILRLIAVGVYLVAAGLGHAVPLTYAGAMFAASASLAALISATHTERNWVTDRGLISTFLSVEDTTVGRRFVNIAGVLEGVGVLLLAVGLYGIPAGGAAALTALAATVCYFGSFGINVFTDPSFYRPLGQPVSPLQRALLLLRQSIGVLAPGVAAGITVWAIRPDLRLVALTICVSLVTVGVRVRELDRYLATTDQVAGHRVEVAHLVMGEDLHGEVNTTIADLKKLAQSGRADNAVVFDTTLQLEHALREMIQHQTHHDEGPLESASTLKGWLDKFATTNQCIVHFDAPDIALDPDTRRIARQLIDGLVVNAAAAAAKNIAVTLQCHDNTWTVTVTDDGHPIDARYWMRDGGGGQRLRDLLNHLGGDLTKRDSSPDGTPKTVTAHWTKMNEKE